MKQSLASPAPKITDDRQTIVGLHYIRAIATILVVAVHAFTVVGRPNAYAIQGSGGFFEFGAGEIDFFFMMSGFIMVASTRDFSTNRARFGAIEFFRRRAIRILPMLWLAILAYALIRHPFSATTDEVLSYVRAAALWPVGRVSPWVAWTIRYEVLFYLVFGCFFLSNQKLYIVGVIWFLAPLTVLSFTTNIDPENARLTWFLFSPFNLEFGIGVAIGFLRRRIGRPIIFRYQLSAIVIVFILVRIVVYTTHIELNSLLFVFVVAPIWAGTILFAIKTDPLKPSRVMIFIGDASYSIFLFHPHVVNIVVAALAHIAPWLAPSVAAFFTIVATVGLTSLIHLFIEKPVVEHARLFFHTFPRGLRLQPKQG